MALALGACGGGSPTLECNTQVTAQCGELYPPTFHNVYTMTLAPHCGSGARSCHSDAGMKGGMTFSTEDNAYAALLEPGQDRVIPGDISCSVMLIRITSTDPAIQMPRGASGALPAAEQCALIKWVAQGALRNPAVPDAATPDASPTDASIDAGFAP